MVLSDTGDTVFGGSAGDSNLILESILRLGIKSRALMPLIEPATVARARGGRRRRDRHAAARRRCGDRVLQAPHVTGTVRKIADGRIRLDDNHQHEIDMGRTVVFEVGPVTLLISELRGLAGNLPGVYEAFGIDPARLQDRGAQDRLELPVFRADHLAGSSAPIRAGRASRDVFDPAVEALPRPDLSARADRRLARRPIARARRADSHNKGRTKRPLGTVAVDRDEHEEPQDMNSGRFRALALVSRGA